MTSTTTTIPSTMKAIVVTEFGDPEVLQLKDDIPIPSLTQSGQALIQLHAAGINPVETYIRSGQYAKLPNLPWTPGFDGAGIVVAMNYDDESDNNGVKVGSRVWLSGSITGTYAQYCVCNKDQIHVLPDSIEDMKQGAAIGIAYRTAYRALFIRAKVQAGQTVLIHGASGGVGIAALQLAKAHGCIVYGTAGTTDGIQLISKFANYTFNHNTENYMKQIHDASNGNGIDCIIEMLANVNLNNDLQILSKGGIIAIVGNRGNININPRLIMQKESSIIGVLGVGTPKEFQQCLSGINGALHSGAIQPILSTTKKFTLEQAIDVHKYIINKDNQGSTGKIILHIDH